MIGHVVGFCRVSPSPSKKSRLFGGDISKIAGKELRVLERNTLGDCLCLGPDNSALVDVDHVDVVSFRPNQTQDPLALLFRLLEEAGQTGTNHV